MNDFINAFLHKYPFETLHEMNLDWIISAMKDVAYELHNFEVANTIHYAGTWDITKQYPTWSVVVDNNFGYISTQPVPAGIAITNTTYWENIADFSALYADLGTRVQFLENTSANWLKGKKIVCYGDSLAKTAGHNTYIDQLAGITGATVTNRGYGGTRMSQGSNNGRELIAAATDLGQYDVITLTYGTNDWQHSSDIGTLYADACALIETIRLKNHNLEIVFILPPYSYRDFGNDKPNLNNAGLYLSDVCNVITYAMNRYNVPVIDLYHLSTCNAINYTYLLRNDSGGIYVHPTDEFASTLAYLVKTYNSSAIARTTEVDMLTTYDFYNAQVGFNQTDFYAAGGLTTDGLFLRLSNNGQDKSVDKTFFYHSFYRFTGECSEDITISIGTWSREIAAGKFDFVTNEIGSSINPVTIIATTACTIYDLHIYEVSFTGKTYAASGKFGTRIKLTNESEDITFYTGLNRPTVTFNNDSISFDGYGGFNVESEIAANTHIITIPYNFTTSGYMQGNIMAVRPVDGTVYPLMIDGNKIKNYQALPTGVYCLAGSIHPNKNPYLIAGDNI